MLKIVMLFLLKIKGFNKNMFFGIPLSTKMKEGKFYYKFQFQKKDELVENIALLSQMRLSFNLKGSAP